MPLLRKPSQEWKRTCHVRSPRCLSSRDPAIWSQSGSYTFTTFSRPASFNHPVKLIPLKVRNKAKKINLLLLDVDGMLTDGGIFIDVHGYVIKRLDLRIS